MKLYKQVYITTHNKTSKLFKKNSLNPLDSSKKKSIPSPLSRYNDITVQHGDTLSIHTHQTHCPSYTLLHGQNSSTTHAEQVEGLSSHVKSAPSFFEVHTFKYIDVGITERLLVEAKNKKTEKTALYMFVGWTQQGSSYSDKLLQDGFSGGFWVITNHTRKTQVNQTLLTVLLPIDALICENKSRGYVQEDFSLTSSMDHAEQARNFQKLVDNMYKNSELPQYYTSLENYTLMPPIGHWQARLTQLYAFDPKNPNSLETLMIDVLDKNGFLAKLATIFGYK